ncbi:MAG TPA: NADH-quinone oxidoreductase subunit L [Vicinamibacterales bacterium]|nr:NADH-quinone oxidoreductase subunit L [Vicinamibacterales bacterium]
MLLLIALFPLAGFLVNSSFGRRISKGAAGAVACGAIILSFAVSVAAVARLAGMPPDDRAITQTVFTWITSGDFSVNLTLRLDPLSSVMILVITGIGSLIHIYSTAYMHEESGSEYARYFSYLNLFAAFMLVLVLGSSFLIMFVGWEGVGLCSYLLVGFWYQKKSASDAGKKAFIVNRIGDWGFILGVLLIFTRFGSLDFQDVARAVAQLSPEQAFGTLSLITLFLFIGATGKSAQIPLFVWLPDAMEGPTPVSALIHAATMVTAGVYMIGRNAVLFGHAPLTMNIVAIVGTATAFFAGTIALVQNDIKKVLAYSTVSQLGYKFLAMGVGAFSAGIFHLYTHAFFKALLFLGSGAVIHALGGEQDMRRMGGLKDQLPITYWTFLIGTIAIAGIPPFAGFFSKDEILFKSFSGGHTLLWFVGIVTALLTACYMFRLVFLTFFGPRHQEHPANPDHPGNSEHHHLHDAPMPMAIALVVLAIGSVAAGWVSVGGRFEKFLEPSFGGPLTGSVGLQADQAAAAGSSETALMILSVAVAVAGIGLAWYFFLRNRKAAGQMAESFSGVHTVLEHKYYLDEIYDAAVVQPVKIVSEEGLWKGVDVGVIDRVVNGVAQFVGGTSEVLRLIQSGSVRVYAASVFFGVVLVLGYYLWR